MLTQYHQERYSATGPSARAGIKVSAPTSNTVPINRPTNSGPCVGNVPELAGWLFLLTSEPAIAITGIITPKRPTNMHNASKQFQNGAKSAAVITQLGDDYSSGLGSYFKEAFAKLGGNIVSEEQFQTNQTDFKAILTNIKAADPDIIFAPSSITTAPLIIKQARELGITATIAAGDTWENSTIIENAGADSEGVVISTFFDEAEPANDEAAAFIKGFKEYLVKEKQEDIIPAVSALGYDSYLAAIKAIEDAGSTDTTAIRDALKNVEIDGVTGNITFNETGDANKDIAFIKTIKDGRFQFLTTTTVE